MKNYEINADTLALIPINNNTVKVYEEDEEFLVNKNVEKFKNTIMIFNILLILSGNIIALWNIVTIIKTKNFN